MCYALPLVVLVLVVVLVLDSSGGLGFERSKCPKGCAMGTSKPPGEPLEWSRFRGQVSGGCFPVRDRVIVAWQFTARDTAGKRSVP